MPESVTMLCGFLARWRAAALAVPSLSLLLMPLAVQAHEPILPTQRGMEQETGFDNLSSITFAAGATAPIYSNSGTNSAGMPVRRVRPDQDRMRQLSGSVVKLKGQTLYVENQGVVVPLDLSALQLRKQPQEGQRVVAVYKVENKTENVALGLQGERGPG
jgi:hypothetical protein